MPGEVPSRVMDVRNFCNSVSEEKLPPRATGLGTSERTSQHMGVLVQAGPWLPGPGPNSHFSILCVRRWSHGLTVLDATIGRFYLNISSLDRIEISCAHTVVNIHAKGAVSLDSINSLQTIDSLKRRIWGCDAQRSIQPHPRHTVQHHSEAMCDAHNVCS